MRNHCVEAICCGRSQDVAKAAQRNSRKKNAQHDQHRFLAIGRVSRRQSQPGRVPVPSQPKPEKDDAAEGNGDRQAGREQRVGLVVLAARVKLGHVLDVHVGNAQRGDAYVGDQDENRGPDAVGFESEVPEQKRHQHHAPGHVHHAGKDSGQHVAAELAMHLAQNRRRHAGARQFPPCIGVQFPVHFLVRRIGNHPEFGHGVCASLRVRAHSAPLRDWRRTNGVMASFQSICSGAPASAARSRQGSTPRNTASST